MSKSGLVSIVIALIAGADATPVFASVPPGGFAGKDAVNGEFRKLPLESPKAGTVVVFLSARCPCSASHEAALKKLHEEFKGEFQFVGIHSNADEDAEVTKSHFSLASLPFPVLMDSDARFADAMSALKTPHAYILSPKGSILYQGGVDDSADAARSKIPHLRNAILAVREGKTPDPDRVRTLGCVIRRP